MINVSFGTTMEFRMSRVTAPSSKVSTKVSIGIPFRVFSHWAPRNKSFHAFLANNFIHPVFNQRMFRIRDTLLLLFALYFSDRPIFVPESNFLPFVVWSSFWKSVVDQRAAQFWSDDRSRHGQSCPPTITGDRSHRISSLPLNGLHVRWKRECTTTSRAPTKHTWTGVDVSVGSQLHIAWAFKTRSPFSVVVCFPIVTFRKANPEAGKESLIFAL